MTDICLSELYSNQTICEVINQLDALTVTATTLKDETLAALDDLKTTSEAGVATVTAVDYPENTLTFAYAPPSTDVTEPDFSTGGPTAPTAPTLGTAPTLAAAPIIPSAYTVGSFTPGAAPTIPVAYTIASHTPGAVPTVPSGYTVASHSVAAAPTVPAEYVPPDDVTVGAGPTIPAAYVVPDANSLLISSTVFNDIYNRNTARLARLAQKEERDASYTAASMGLGLPSTTLLKRLERAQHGTNVKISETAMESAIQEGVWLREDVKTLHGFHIQNWPLKPELDVKVYEIEETLLIEAYKASSDTGIRAWPLKFQFDLDAWRLGEGYELDAYKTETTANVQNWSLAPQLELDSYKAQEGLELDAYKTETQAQVQNWALRPQLDVELYRTTETLELNAYQTETNANVTNWPEHPRLEISAWQTEGDLDSRFYKTAEDAKNSNYSAQVSGFGSEVQWTVGYLNAESTRFNARLVHLRADIESEAARRGWSELELRNTLEQADKATQYALGKARVILETTLQAEQAISQLMAGLTQAVYSAADYQLSGSGEQRVTETI